MFLIPWLITAYLVLGGILVSIAYILYTPEQRTLENKALNRSYELFIELLGEGFIVRPVYKFWMYFFTVTLWLPLMLIKN
jgi:hypothetical protein